MLQNGNIKSDGHVEQSWSKPQQGWLETTLYSLHKGDGQPPVTKVFTQSGEGPHPKLSTTYSDVDNGRSKLLSSHLEQILSKVPSTQQDNQGGKAVWPKGKLHYLSYIRPASSDHAEPQSQVSFSSKIQRPNLDRLLLRAGSNRQNAKEPLGDMDGKINCLIVCFRNFILYSFYIEFMLVLFKGKFCFLFCFVLFFKHFLLS